MKILKYISLASSILVLASSALTAQTAAEITAKFGEFSLASESLNLKGRLFVPDSYVPEKEYPVVVTLHGLGECGSDNNIQVLVNHMATSWGTDDFQAEHPCFIYTPQCAVGSSWGTSNVYNSLIVMIDSLISYYSIDTTRIYLTGLSMGGIGTWFNLYNHPSIFAAAIPVCGWISDNEELQSTMIEGIRDIPVWNFHGGVDATVATSNSRRIMDDYRDLNQIPLFTHAYGRLDFDLSDEDLETYIDNHVDLLYSEVRGVGHDVWNEAYQTPLAKEWLFKQRLHSSESIIVDKLGEIGKVSGSKEFTYSVSEFVDSVGVWYGQLDTAYMEFIGGMKPSKGSYTFDSEDYDDFPFSILKFLAFDTAGYVIGKDYSDVFCINNDGNGPPYIELLNDLALLSSNISLRNYTMKVKVADPESDLLHITFSVSLDDGSTFEDLEDDDVSGEIYEQYINLEELLKVDKMIIRASVTDNEYTSSVQTLYFRNRYGYEVSVIPVITNNFKIYPNPAGEYLNLEFDAFESGQLEVKLVSMDGRIIKSLIKEEIEDGRRMLTIPVKKVAGGSYILQVSMDGKNQFSKLVLVD
ncbi:T9SS type A sorting domain-containing protein [Bacteroidota bacterium]